MNKFFPLVDKNDEKADIDVWSIFKQDLGRKIINNKESIIKSNGKNKKSVLRFFIRFSFAIKLMKPKFVTSLTLKKNILFFIKKKGQTMKLIQKRGVKLEIHFHQKIYQLWM
jgi:hypothetical protein